ncbi:MAG: hypothetical protein IGR92_12760 [Leptolyngbyaceae cyanobacterium T60_A2020_046]|nr:hypothetical protein [Leptolyngbyaceae cyanobacterium T60_A2020_046]
MTKLVNDLSRSGDRSTPDFCQTGAIAASPAEVVNRPWIAPDFGQPDSRFRPTLWVRMPTRGGLVSLQGDRMRFHNIH